jgi:transcriptional regulator with XRE-family HTH domain
MPESRPSASTEIFPKRLKAARELRGLSQDQVAERSGLQSSAVSHFETGNRKPSFDNLKRLADALRVSTDYLLGRTNEPEGQAVPDDPLYRDLQRLNSSNREFAREMIARLAASKQRGGG